MSNQNNYHFAENAVIKNAHVVDPANKLDSVMDVHVKDGKVVKWGKSLSVEGAHTFDASGLHLLPGLIDVQVHFRDPGFEHKESLETGIQAAIKGGFVACVTMPNTKPTCDNAQIVKNGWISDTWIKKYIDNPNLDIKYINKFLGLLAFEIWYRLFITKEMNENDKL